MPPARIYLDHAATTPVLPAVREAMLPWLSGEYGNPSSLHGEGRRAKEAIDEARESLSQALGSLFAEVLFTSSGTEAANLAIIGAAISNPDPARKRVLLGAAEHHCVLHTESVLRRLGYQVESIPVDRVGRVQLDHLEAQLGDDVLLVSVMHANNELGTIQPVREIGDMAHRHSSLFHTDAVQTFLAFGTEPLVETTGADLITLSAHKINGPKGVGAIYIKAGVKLAPLALGGGQEREMRAGTENIAGIVGFGAAVRARRTSPLSGVREARDTFLDGIVSGGAVPTVPDREATLGGHAHVRFPGVQAESMLILLDRLGIAASSGAACSSGSLEPSHVLLACGYTADEAKEGLRFTFGLGSTIEDSRRAAEIVVSAADRIRAFAPQDQE